MNLINFVYNILHNSVIVIYNVIFEKKFALNAHKILPKIQIREYAVHNDTIR